MSSTSSEQDSVTLTAACQDQLEDVLVWRALDLANLLGKKANVKPTLAYQCALALADYSARVGSPSQFGFGRPSAPRVISIRPVEGCMSAAKVIPTATVLTSTGKNRMPQNSVFSRMLEVNNTANGSAMMTLSPLVMMA
jgi:hypothetical protein